MVKPFELSLEYQSDTITGYPNVTPTNPEGTINTEFKGPSEMIIFCWYDCVIAVNTSGVTVVGRS